METHVVTGAYGFTGKYIAQELLARGYDVRTLTHSPNRPNPFGDRVEPYPYSFDDPDKLVDTLSEAAVLHNTYWVRFDYSDDDLSFSHDGALKNSETLFAAAEDAGIERVVHVSVSNPSVDSDLSYYRGKALVEEALKETGLSYSILRPTLLFAQDNLLLNNIAWLLRRFPVFGVFGDGQYRLEPISVEDFASVAADQSQPRENSTLTTVGPETFTYREMVRLIGQAIGKSRPIVSMPDLLGLAVAKVISYLKDDVILNQAEIEGLKRELLYTGAEPIGETSMAEWLRSHGDQLGREYMHELDLRRTDSATRLPPPAAARRTD